MLPRCARPQERHRKKRGMDLSDKHLDPFSSPGPHSPASDMEPCSYLTGIAFKTQRLASLASCCSIWATSQFCPGQQADQSGVRQQRQPVRADWCCRWRVPLPAGFSLPRACPHRTGTGQERHATTQGEPPGSQSQQRLWSSLTLLGYQWGSKEAKHLLKHIVRR